MIQWQKTKWLAINIIKKNDQTLPHTKNTIHHHKHCGQTNIQLIYKTLNLII